ncbi:hypothetical protein QCA50_007454 [Cerrena zonata]|uniref:Uncharacterized protein n=1 Tax=Cerrena zonata TaxID=2478898 RepID=A0AAW0GE48_9APHY
MSSPSNTMTQSGKRKLIGRRISRIVYKLPRLVGKLKSLVNRQRKLKGANPGTSYSPSIAASSASMEYNIMPVLPVEVWENVIDLLVADYTRPDRNYFDSVKLRYDLISCALVCHAWLPRAQMHLCIYLYIVGSGISSYEKLIQRLPTLCAYAKELEFRNTSISNFNDQVVGKMVETASHVVRVVHKLPYIYTLGIDYINLSIEHPHLPRYVTMLTSVKQL